MLVTVRVLELAYDWTLLERGWRVWQAMQGAAVSLLHKPDAAPLSPHALVRSIIAGPHFQECTPKYLTILAAAYVKFKKGHSKIFCNARIGFRKNL